METPLDTLNPLNYAEWVRYKPAKSEGRSNQEYLDYLKAWYKNKSEKNKASRNVYREDYIQLLKDLNFLYNSDTNDRFLRDIDYNNEEDLILAIPFFAKKLKQIAKVLNAKREAIKRAKAQYNLIGSNSGLEKLLKEYVLRAFTSKRGETVQMPVALLKTHFPEISAVKNNFFIEIEELHDPNTYHDNDPNVSITEYFDGKNLEDYFPLEGNLDTPITLDDVLKIVSSKILPRAADTPLMNVFQNYLATLTNNPSISASLVTDTSNKIIATQKYVSENIYGVTAVQIEDIVQPDQILQIDIADGSNWFLWPSGFQILSTNVYNNTFEPIKLTNSSLVESGATAGTQWQDSDLIFSDKNGIVEGAWLQSTYQKSVSGYTEISLKDREISQFLYPFVGFGLNSETLRFGGHTLTYLSGSNLRVFNVLPAQRQQEILTEYYTTPLPSISVKAKYINNTTLIASGAYAAKVSYKADQITRRPHSYSTPINYQDNLLGATEAAYLYKLDKTDIVVRTGDNLIYWPVQTFDVTENVSVVYKREDCLPVRLLDTNPSETVRGAVVGLNFDTSDVIYKLNSRSSIEDATEAAWLGSDSLSALDILDGDIPIYNSKPVQCADCIDGPIGTTLAFRVNAGERVSFIWVGKDTYADEVFKYVEHAENCPYGQKYPHDYYSDQGYINPLDESDTSYWTECTCKSSVFSPIGHSGKMNQDYNGVTDLLYADPFDLGVNFSFTYWKDTRGFTYKNSPQFSFYKLDNFKGDKPLGYGTGNWVTNGVTAMGNNRMVLKTGRRYTYYRSSLRRDATSGSSGVAGFVASPYLIVNTPYRFAESKMCQSDYPLDVVVILDMSRSQSVDFDEMKFAAGQICVELTKNRQETTQVGFVAFAEKETVISYLTADGYKIAVQMGGLKISNNYPEYKTDISLALLLAQTILLKEGTLLTSDRITLIKQLCKNTNLVIDVLGDVSRGVNFPQLYAGKKIILISDGVITSNANAALIVDALGNPITDENGKVQVDPNVSPQGNLIRIANDIKNGIDRSVLPSGEKVTPIEIATVNMGPLSITNNVMRDIASSEQLFFNLQRYLKNGDGEIGGYISYISRVISGCYPFRPTWLKAVKDESGTWVGTNEPSDMVLTPGDYLIYHHKAQTVYQNITRNRSLTVRSIPFTINIKLDGWDYQTNKFDPLNIGEEFGAKPFWADIPVSVYPLAGEIRFKEEHVPVHQPEVSKMIIRTGDYLEYNRVGLGSLNWAEPQTFTETLTANNWKKLELKETFSNLTDFLKSGYRDVLIEGTFEPSQMLLESYSEYKAARYHYISKNSFTYNEPLYLRNKCKSNFVLFLTSLILQPSEPYANLTNIFYPTVATVSFPSLTISESEVGGYLLPENLGVSHYRGKGFTYKINENTLSAVDASVDNAERVFVDLHKYGNRNRGLTKRDQLSPVVLQDLNNNWVIEPYSAGDKAGVIINNKENQKFTPYQSGYEVDKLTYGLARQEDQFQFWDFKGDFAVWNEPNTNINFGGANQSQSFYSRLNRLLINKGSLTQWRTDLMGNDYGLYKFLPPEPVDLIVKRELFPLAVLSQTTSRSFVENSYVALAVTLSGSEPYSFQWYKNLKPIYGANLPHLTFHRITLEDGATYYCRINNSISTVRTNNINVIVLPSS